MSCWQSFGALRVEKLSASRREEAKEEVLDRDGECDMGMNGGWETEANRSRFPWDEIQDKQAGR